MKPYPNQYWVNVAVIGACGIFHVVSTGYALGQERPKTRKLTNPIEQHYQAAQTFQMAGDFEKAAMEYRAAIADGLDRIGNLRMARHELAEASELLESAVQMDENNIGARVDLAIAHYEAGDYVQAKVTVENALERSPSDARALEFAGKFYFIQGDYAKAEEKLASTLQLQPNFDIGYLLALTDLALKKPIPANVIFDEMLASTKPDAGMRVLIGIAYRDSGYLDQAIVHLTKAVELEPKKPNVHAALGVTLFLQGPAHDEEARSEFKQELQLNPQDLTSLRYLGLIEARQGRSQEAHQWLSQALTARPGDPETLFTIGKVQLDLGEYQAAAGHFRKALEKDDRYKPVLNAADVHEHLAQALERLGQREEAGKEIAAAQKERTSPDGVVKVPDSSKELERALHIADRHDGPLTDGQNAYIRGVSMLLGEAYHNLGVIAARGAHYSEAEHDFMRAARWNPAIQTLDRNWGIAAFRAQKYEQAVDPLARELERNPADSSLRQMLGLSYYMADQFSKCAETLRPILDQLPDNPGLRYAAGVALVRSGDDASGRKLLAGLLERNANSPELHVMVGQAYSEQSQYDDALRELQQALQLNPRLPQAHYAIGLIEFKQGRLDDAINEFQTELSVDPDSAASEYQIACIQLQQSRPKDAIPLLNDVLKREPDYADGHYQLGKAHLSLGDAASAIGHLELAVRLKPDQAYSYYQLSLAYERLGRSDDAKKALQTFRQLKDEKQKKARVSSRKSE